ncbi:MAG: hypothetical protein AAGM22_04590 [Acidobacteriota bacterium]
MIAGRRPKNVGPSSRLEGSALRTEMVRLGVAPGPRAAELPRRSPGEGLVELLTLLGPLASDFGRYIARRSDLALFETDDLDRLAATPTGPPRPQESGIRSRLVAALGHRATALADVAEQPELWDWSGQWHRGRGLDGRPIRLFVAHANLDGHIDETATPLRELSEVLGWPAQVVTDFFTEVVTPRRDLEERRRLLARLQTAGGSRLVIPAVIGELCADGMLAVEDRPDAEGLLTGGPLRSRGPAAARLVASAYIELLGQGVCVDEPVLARLSDGRGLLLDAGLRELPGAPAVLEFLRATAGERLEDVAALWGQGAEGRRGTEASDLTPEALRSLLRQATPRRGGPRDAGETVAEYALAYWRAARGHGVVLGRPWRTALPALDGLRRRFAAWDPDGDPLADALLEQSWREGWGRVREVASSPEQLGMWLDRYASAMLEAPAVLERLLDSPPPPGERGIRSRPTSPSAPRSEWAWPDAVAWLFALAALALTVRTFNHVPVIEAAASVLAAAVSGCFLFRWWR